MTLHWSLLLATSMVVASLLVGPAEAQTQALSGPTQELLSDAGTPWGHAPTLSATTASVSPVPASSTWWDQRYHPNHAQGRANVASLGALLVGSSLTAAANPFDGSSWTPPYVAGICLSALGLTVGPSLGLWCTGNSRVAWQSLAVRTGGLGAFGIGMWRLVRTDDAENTTPGDIISAPFRFLMHALPGAIILSAGIRWALDATPNQWCDGTSQARAQATLQPHMDATGQGLALRVTW